MVSLTALVAFSAVALGMVLTPGPNMAYLVSRSICQGRTAGLISLAGVALGFEDADFEIGEQAAVVRFPGNAEVVIGDSVLNAELRALSVDAAMRYSLELSLPRTPGLLPGKMLQVRLP